MDTGKSIAEYLGELQSDSPTPGGGNVAALCGALSASLGIMVSNLTIGKKKYAQVEEEIKGIREALAALPAEFTRLAAEDNAAFDAVMAAFKLPKETEEQKAARSAAITAATLGAAEVPAKVLRLCAHIAPFIQALAQKGNQNSLSDAGVAAALLSAAGTGAWLNVLINCGSIPDNPAAAELRTSCAEVIQQVRLAAAGISGAIERELGGHE